MLGSLAVKGGAGGIAGGFIVKLVEKVPLTIGRWLCGHRASGTAEAGSTRGRHMGNPVAAEIVGFSESTVNRWSGVLTRPKRPDGSLIRTRAPAVELPMGPPTRISPVA